MKKTLKTWKNELGSSLIILLIIFMIFNMDNPFGAIIMAVKVFIFILLPGTLLANLLFKDMKRYELMIIGMGFGLIITPLLMYLIGIFELVHTKIFTYIIPVLYLIIFGYLNYRK